MTIPTDTKSAESLMAERASRLERARKNAVSPIGIGVIIMLDDIEDRILSLEADLAEARALLDAANAAARDYRARFEESEARCCYESGGCPLHGASA